MELLLILRVLLRRWWLVLIPTFIAAALALPALLDNQAATAGGYGTVIRYSAAQELTAIAGRDGDYQDVWLASELTVNALTAWITTTTFKREVAEVLAEDGLIIDPLALSVIGDNERSVGQISLSWPDAEQLEAIVQAAIKVLKTRSQNYFPQLGNQPAHVTILDDPVITAAPPAIANRFAPFLRMGIGLLAGLMLAFLAEYLDPTVREKREIEALGVMVIATIPREKR